MLDRLILFSYDARMTPEPDVPVEMHRHLENLAKQGKHVNRLQRWILITCYDNYHSILELAAKENVTYRHIHNNVNGLVQMGLLDKAYKSGNTWYYKCRFDLSETADYSYRFTIRKQQLTFEDLLFYYYSNEAESFSRPVMSALIYLYHRSENRTNNIQTPGPSGAEVKSFLLAMCDQIQEYAMNIRVLAEGKLFEQSPECHELYGPVEGELYDDLYRRWEPALQTWWANKQISTRGIKLPSAKETTQSGRVKYDSDNELRILNRGQETE